MMQLYNIEHDGLNDRNAVRRLASLNHFDYPCVVTLIGGSASKDYYCELTNVGPSKPMVFNWCNERKIAYL